MTSSLPPTGSAKARLERRSQAVARLRHPNLVRMLPLPGGAGLSPVLGESRRLADFTLPAGTFKRFDLEQVVRLLLDVLSGLAALHEVVTDGETFVHGEVSPQHVYIDEHGTARLVPLLTSHLTGSSRPEHSGYVAPERIAGLPIDARADVFSVGVMLWEALAGARLFPDATLAAVRSRLAGSLRPRLAERDRWAEPLCAIALRAIAEDPAQRFQTSLDFSHALATAAAQRLARVDSDAWQEEAPTPVFQPRLHLATLRPQATPPPLPVEPPSVELCGPETAPPTTSEEHIATTAPSTGARRPRSVWAAVAVISALGAWVIAYQVPRGWQRLLTAAPIASEALSLRAAAAPFAQATPPRPAPQFAPQSAPPPSLASAARGAPPATSAGLNPLSSAGAGSRPAPSHHPIQSLRLAPPLKPKAKPARDYGI